MAGVRGGWRRLDSGSHAHLWLRPLVFCLPCGGGAGLCGSASETGSHQQVPGSEARHEHGKPGRVQVEVDENLISTLLGSQSGCHVRGCRWACGLDAAMDSRAGSGTCDWLPQVWGARRPGEVRPEPGKAVQLLPHLPFHRLVDTDYLQHCCMVPSLADSLVHPVASVSPDGPCQTSLAVRSVMTLSPSATCDRGSRPSRHQME